MQLFHKRAVCKIHIMRMLYVHLVYKPARIAVRRNSGRTVVTDKLFRQGKTDYAFAVLYAARRMHHRTYERTGTVCVRKAFLRLRNNKRKAAVFLKFFKICAESGKNFFIIRARFKFYRVPGNCNRRNSIFSGRNFCRTGSRFFQRNDVQFLRTERKIIFNADKRIFLCPKQRILFHILPCPKNNV